MAIEVIKNDVVTTVTIPIHYYADLIRMSERVEIAMEMIYDATDEKSTYMDAAPLAKVLGFNLKQRACEGMSNER